MRATHSRTPRRGYAALANFGLLAARGACCTVCEKQPKFVFFFGRGQKITSQKCADGTIVPPFGVPVTIPDRTPLPPKSASDDAAKTTFIWVLGETPPKEGRLVHTFMPCVLAT